MASPAAGQDVPSEPPREELEHSERNRPEPACQEAQKWIEVSGVAEQRRRGPAATAQRAWNGSNGDTPWAGIEICGPAAALGASSPVRDTAQCQVHVWDDGCAAWPNNCVPKVSTRVSLSGKSNTEPSDVTDLWRRLMLKRNDYTRSFPLVRVPLSNGTRFLLAARSNAPSSGARGFRLPWIWNRASIHARDAALSQQLIGWDYRSCSAASLASSGRLKTPLSVSLSYVMTYFTFFHRLFFHFRL